MEIRDAYWNEWTEGVVILLPKLIQFFLGLCLAHGRQNHVKASKA